MKRTDIKQKDEKEKDSEFKIINDKIKDKSNRDKILLSFGDEENEWPDFNPSKSSMKVEFKIIQLMLINNLIILKYEIKYIEAVEVTLYLG